MATLHIVLLLSFLTWGLWPRRHDIASTICALFLLSWTTLVCTALLLGYWGLLGNLIAYEAISLSFATVFALLLRRMNHLLPAAAAISQDKGTRIDRWINLFLWFAILIVLVQTAMICTFYVSNNFDSVAYRFPRAMFYIEQGSLHQVPGDSRIQFYPFDISLAYIWFAIHNLAGTWFNLFGFLTWLVGGVAVWRFARDIGARHTASLFASALFITTPAVLVSASSTNDDLLAGVPLLIGVMFLVRWWKTGSWHDAMFAAMGIGLSAGSKLHLAMMAPIAGLLIIGIVFRLVKTRSFKSFFQPRGAKIAAAILVIAILALPVFIVNYSESGMLVFDIPGFLNTPFSLVSASVHSLISTASMFFGPIPDLYLGHTQDARKAFGDAYNVWINNLFFSWVTPSLHYSHEPYFYFDGVVSNAAHFGVNEVSVWLGFVPWLLVLVIILALRQKPSYFRSVALWLALAFFAWHFTRCFQLKYVRGEGIYYAFSMALAAPALAWLWEYGAHKRKLAGALVISACIGVLAANLVSAANYFAFNYQRNIPSLRASHFQPNQQVFSPQLSDTLKASQRTLIAYSQWELPYFLFMTEHPSARYATSTELHATPNADYDLALVLARGGTEIPLVFDHDDRTRLSLIGTALTLYGTQRVFGTGKAVASQTSNEASIFAIFQLHQQRNDKGGLASISFSNFYGIDKDEHLMFSITYFAQNTAAKLVLAAEPWPKVGAINVPGQPLDGMLHIRFWRRDNPKIASHMWLPINPSANWNVMNMRDLVRYDAQELSKQNAHTMGWQPEEGGYSRMSQKKSAIRFPLLHGLSACSVGMDTVTTGSGQLTLTLNGKVIQRLVLRDKDTSQTQQLKLPDGAIRAGENVLEFLINGKAATARPTMFGLRSLAIDCGLRKDFPADLNTTPELKEQLRGL
ncbi:MAG: hypothetical protein WC734_06415 [Patescibacteria group bacterium]|jgi:hypothetical protein